MQGEVYKTDKSRGCYKGNKENIKIKERIKTFIEYVYFNLFDVLVRICKEISSLIFLIYKNKKDLKKFHRIIKDKNKRKNMLVVFNRKDRIGDAIVTTIFLLNFIKKYPEVKFKILASKYNFWVFYNFFRKNTEIESNRINGRIILDLLKDRMVPFFMKKRKEKKIRIYIDSMDDYITSSYYKKRSFKVISFMSLSKGVLFENILISDFILNDFYVTYGKYHIIEKFCKIFSINKKSIDDFPEELKKKVEENYKRPERFLRKNKISEKGFIIIFVGNKNFRNFLPEEWIEIIKNIDYKGKIIIVDDPIKKRIEKIEAEIKKYKKKIIFMKEDYNLWELMYLSSKSKWLIGIDGGGFNFMQIPTNAINIIFYTNEKVWRPFSQNRYKIYKKIGKIIVEETKTKRGFKKYIIYKKDNKKYLWEYFKKRNGKLIRDLMKKEVIKTINDIIKRDS